MILGITGRLKSLSFPIFSKKVVVIKSNKMEVLPNPIVYANEYEGKIFFSEVSSLIPGPLGYFVINISINKKKKYRILNPVN